MQYLLLIYEDESQRKPEGSPEEAEDFRAYGAFTEHVQKKGAFIGGEALETTAHATSVRVRNDKRSITDGPFAETKEQLGGYYLLECENLDEAITYASQIPAAQRGCVEIRPLKFCGTKDGP